MRWWTEGGGGVVGSDRYCFTWFVLLQVLLASVVGWGVGLGGGGVVGS